MSKKGKILIGVIGLILLWLGTLYVRRAPIETDLTARVQAALNNPEFQSVTINFEGRDGTISGQVAAESVAVKAENLARQVWGVRQIQNLLQFGTKTSMQPAFLIGLKGQFQAEDLILTGLSSDSLQLQPIIQRLAKTPGLDSIRASFQRQAGVEIPDQFFSALKLFFNLPDLTEGEFEVNRTTFTLKGKVPSIAVKNQIEALVKAELGSLKFVNELTVSAGVLPAITLQQITNFLQTHPVEFDNNSSEITPPASQTLNTLVTMLRQAGTFKMQIKGHTDAIGSEAANIQLAQARSQAVRDYLIAQGIPAAQLSLRSFGESVPVADNQLPSGRQRNRRVELTIE